MTFILKQVAVEKNVKQTLIIAAGMLQGLKIWGAGANCNVGAKNLGERAVRAEPKSGGVA